MNKSRKREKGFSVIEILIVIVIIALICAAGWYVYNIQRKSLDMNGTGSTKNSSSSTSKKSATSNSDNNASSTSEWATYTSSLGGFSFKYPTSGWTFDGFQSYNPVSGSQMNGNETQLRLFKTNSTYSIIINIGTISQVETESDSYSQGTAVALSNGLQAWQTNSSAVGNPQCYSGSPIDLDLVSDGNFYYLLSNGQYLSFYASFCYAQKDITNLSYQQQVKAPEVTVAKKILATFTFKQSATN